MTETQTPNPDCSDCAGTGLIPPFMDACDCDATTILAGTLNHSVEADGTVIVRVWDGTSWQPVLGMGSTPAGLPPLTSTPPVWADTDYDAGAAMAEADTELADLLEDEDEIATRYATEAEEALIAVADDMVADAMGVMHATPTRKKASGRPMSAPQEALLSRLIAERDPSHPVVAHATDKASGALLSHEASKLIDALMAVPANPALKPARPNNYDGICTKCSGAVPATTGRIEKVDGRWKTFHLDGGCLTAEAKAAMDADRVDEPGLYRYDNAVATDIYRVRKSRSSSRLYAEKVIPHGDGTASFAYNGKAIFLLRKSDKLTWAEARDFGAAFGACVACGRTLSDPRSLVQGYGNTCAGRYHWPTVTTKQAEAIIEGVLTWDDVISSLGVLTA